MERKLRNVATVVCAMTMATLGVGNTKAASLPQGSTLSLAPVSSTGTCITKTGLLVIHHLDGSPFLVGTQPSALATTYTMTICPRTNSAGQTSGRGQVTPHKAVQFSTGPRYTLVHCMPHNPLRFQPDTYYATGRVNGGCSYPNGMAAAGLVYDAGNGWIRFYSYYIQTGTYGYGDVTFACGGPCDITLGSGKTQNLSWTGAQMWYSVNDGSYITNVFCYT